MSLRDENDVENSPHRRAELEVGEMDRGPGEKGSRREQRIRRSITRNLPALIFSGVAAVVFVQRFEFAPDIQGWVSALILFVLIALMAYIFWVICAIGLDHIKAAIVFLKEGNNSVRDLGVDSGNSEAALPNEKNTPRSRREIWLWWIKWLSRLAQTLCGLVFFLGLYLAFVLDDHGVFSLLQYLSWSIPLFLIVFLIGLGGCGLILAIPWQWRELKCGGILGSLVMGILITALAIAVMPMVAPHVLAAIPDVFSGPKTTSQAQCLSGDMQIRYAMNDSYRSPLPQQRYIEYTFVLSDGQGEPFETTMRTMSVNRQSPLATALHMRCGTGLPFTLVYFPSTKRVVDVY